MHFGRVQHSPFIVSHLLWKRKKDTKQAFRGIAGDPNDTKHWCTVVILMQLVLSSLDASQPTVLGFTAKDWSWFSVVKGNSWSHCTSYKASFTSPVISDFGHCRTYIKIFKSYFHYEHPYYFTVSLYSSAITCPLFH